MGGSKRFNEHSVGEPNERAGSAGVDTTPICGEALADALMDRWIFDAFHDTRLCFTLLC